MLALHSFKTLAPTFLSLALLCGCAIEGSGHIETIDPELQGDIQELKVHSGLHATITQGKKRSLRITGDDNLLEELVVRESQGTLEIGFPDSLSGYRPTQPIVVEASLPIATQFSSSGGGHLTLKDTFKGDDFSFDISGGGKLVAEDLRATSVFLDQSGGGSARLSDLDVETVLINSTGGGEVRLTGQTSELEAEVSGGGRLEALELQAKSVTLDLSGGSDAKVHATSSLRAHVSGGGSVTYRGKPKTIEKDLSGGSELKPE